MARTVQEPSLRQERLIAFAAGELSDVDAAEVEASLPGDPAGARCVRIYRAARAAFLAGGDPPLETKRRARAAFDPRVGGDATRWLRRVGPLVATVVLDSRTLPLAGCRGSSSAFDLGYASPLGDVDLRAEPDDASGGWTILGQVDAHRGRPVRAVVLADREPGAEPRHADHDASGAFRIEAGPGEYDLLVRIGETVVILEAIELP